MASKLPLEILVLDDDRVSREALRDILASDERDVILAESSEHALELLQNHQPRLLIVDLHLPGMPGTEFIKRIRTNGAFAQTPVALYTASDISAALQDFMQLMRIEHVIPKPAEAEEIESVVRNALA